MTIPNADAAFLLQAVLARSGARKARGLQGLPWSLPAYISTGVAFVFLPSFSSLGRNLTLRPLIDVSPFFSFFPAARTPTPVLLQRDSLGWCSLLPR